MPKVIDRVWYMLAAVVIFMALLVSIARLLTPVLMEHRADFERIASDLLKRPVMIRQIEITWNRYEPEIALEGVTILDADTKTPKAEMDKLEIDFNIWRSLLTRTVYVQSITVSGMEVTISHAASGQVQVGDMGSINIKDNLTGQALQSDSTFNWIFSQPQLAVRNIRIHYVADQYPARSITLKLLMLRNTAEHHVLDGIATLNQEMPVNVNIHLGWDGDVRKLPEANGHIYLYFEGLSLPQWLGKREWQGLSVTQGLASTKLWVRWNHNKIYLIQNTFEIYNLALYSNIEKRTELVNRVSGNLGWKLDGKNEIYAGDQIYLDFPDHLWPVTNFNVNLTRAADQSIKVNSFRFDYADIGDIRRLALMTSLIPATTRQNLTALNPRGQLLNVTATVPSDINDVAHWLLEGKWQNISCAPWQTYPGVQHFSGSGKWDGEKANVTLLSHKTALTFDQLFATPLDFENLTGDMQAEKNATGNWQVETSNLHVDNKNITADLKMGLTLPTTADAAPSVDLNGHFTVKDAAQVITYLPQKKFAADLVKWLHAAFAGGNVMGTAVVQGNLKDFPFDDNKQGKFLITSQLQGVDFQYAPGWPHIQLTEGDLTFTGRAVQINIGSGTLLNIPLKDIHGLIPYIGDGQMEVVNVDGVITSTLANGFNFMRNSPLNKILGKDLSLLTITGPMELKLHLAIPLATPNATKVNGTITTTNAELSLPAWKIALDKLTGAIQFTENDLTATNMQAQLFNTPVTLQLATLHKDKQPAQTQINLTSKISIPTLEKWLNKKLSSVATGATNYQLQVLLASRTAEHAPPDEVIITTDLKGIALALPAQYGKTAAEQKNLQVTVDLNDSKFLRLLFAYNNMLSAALNLSRDTNQELTLYGGEISFGTKNASWQNNPGLLITGDVPEFDVATWQNYFAAQNGTADANKPPDLKMLRGVDLSAGVLTIMNLQLHDAHLQIMPQPTAWDIKINSREIGGSMGVPFVVAGKTLVGHFDHLNLNSSMATGKESNLSPKTIPAMQLDINEVRYEDMDFGHVMLDVAPGVGGLMIQSLRINDANLQLNATGKWTSSGTSLQGQINTKHFSDMLIQLGFHSSNLVASVGKIDFNIGWPAAPFAPSLSRLNGTLTLDLGEGKIINLSESTNSKIGLGRLLNLFSLESLTHSLSMDFNDMGKGYGFDSVKADFNFRDGNAFTDNLRIEGAVASVGVKGRIGLQAKDLDLKLAIEAHVTGSLPVVAAIAGGPALGPVLGVATWMVGKVVSHQVSRATSYDYSVTGSWANPNWQKISGR